VERHRDNLLVMSVQHTNTLIVSAAWVRRLGLSAITPDDILKVVAALNGAGDFARCLPSLLSRLALNVCGDFPLPWDSREEHQW